MKRHLLKQCPKADDSTCATAISKAKEAGKKSRQALPYTVTEDSTTEQVDSRVTPQHGNSFICYPLL